LALLGTVVALGIRAGSESLFFQAPTGDELVRVQWALASIAPDGRSISIGVPTGDCSRFYKAEAVAVPGGFEVKVLNKEPVDGNRLCLDYLRVERRMVRLPRPLRDRELIGECVPGSATLEQRLCEALNLPWSDSDTGAAAEAGLR
jgi:hypothetical protein